MWSIQSRFRIVVLIFVSILFFAVRDSFSMIFLWPQVAMILLCGFLLLIVQHFSQLKKKAPDVWETITDYPSSFAVPILILVGVIAFARCLRSDSKSDSDGSLHSLESESWGNGAVTWQRG